MALCWISRMKIVRSPVFCQQSYSRTLSSSVTISALGDFYLSVHPDFFAQHPQMQKVNESSLKRLNSYLEAVQCTRQIKNLQPTKVSFYFRKENDQSPGDFRLVNFTLRSHDLLTNIEHILISCGLSASHLNKVEEKAELPIQERYRTTTYNEMHSSKIFQDNESRREESGSSLGLRKWLQKNISHIKEQQKSSVSIRESNETLKNDLCLKYGLREIAWCSPWQYGSEQGILRNFARFCAQHYDKLLCLQGKKLVFTDRTMAAADESICLNVGDVPQQWLQFLSKYEETFSKYFETASKLDSLVCDRCGNIRVMRPKVRMSQFREHSLVSISEYISILSKVTKNLQIAHSYKELKFSPWSMRNHTITFVCLQGDEETKITVLPNGSFRVDRSCDPRHMLSFLIQNKLLAEERKYLSVSEKARCRQLISLCHEKLGVLSLVKDFDVEYHQTAQCCEKLLRNWPEFSILMKGLEIRITSNYFSVFDHGQVCLPWNWKT